MNVSKTMTTMMVVMEPGEADGDLFELAVVVWVPWYVVGVPVLWQAA